VTARAPSPAIHPTAVIDPDASIAEGATVGPYAVVGAGVTLGRDVRIGAHAVLEGPCFLGDRVQVHPFALVGGAPQDRTYRGEPTPLHVGDDTVIREHATLHRGTLKDRGETRVGRRCLVMVGVHVAHDASIGDDCVIANHSEIAGHVVLEDAVVLGGAVAIAPFVRIGRMAFVAAGARVEQSIPPYLIAQGDRACIRGLNTVGLRRNGVDEASIGALLQAYRRRYRADGSTSASDERSRELAASSDPHVAALGRFLVANVTAPAARSLGR
jgi:UDP-N-acetylglucosamine acyltransferase